MKKGVFILMLMASTSVVFSKSNIIQNSIGPTLSHTKLQDSTLGDLFKSLDKSILNSKDESLIREYLKKKNVEFANYVATKYPEYNSDGFIDVNTSDATLHYFVFSLYEANEFEKLAIDKNSVTTSRAANIPNWLMCTLGVLDASYGVSEIIGTLGTFSGSTVWQVVKWFVKKYVAGWLNTAAALVAIAYECF